MGKALEYFLGSSHWLAAWNAPLEECVERLAESIRNVIGREQMQGDALDDQVSATAAQKEELSADAFIGRETELTHLSQTLDRVIAENGQMDMLVGEPGIGKSRLAEELSSYAQNKGMRVLNGRCLEERGAPPFWPWVQAVRTYLAETSIENLTKILGPRASLVATIFPEINDQVSDLRAFESGTQDPEAVRFRLFDAATTFLIDISKDKPTLLVLDDLHWADESSLKLLVFLARELKRSHLFVLGTYRDTELNRKHPLSDTLGELTRERLFERHRLRGLILHEVHSYIQAVSGIQPSDQLASTAFELTNGNPLFVCQMARLLAQDEEFLEDAHIRLPEGVREVIGRRLNHLSQECNDILTVASVLGPEFRLRELIIAVGGESENKVLNALDEATKAYFIEQSSDRAGAYRFTHALVQETIASEISLSQGVRLHAKIIEALEQLYAENLSMHAERLAEHAAKAETVLGADKLVQYSLLAGEQAINRHAPKEALHYFGQGLIALEDGPLDGKKADLLFGVGKAQNQLDTVTEAEVSKSLSRAMDYYEMISDVERVASIGAMPAGDITLCERALRVLPPESHEAGGVLSQHGFLLMERGRDLDLAKEKFQNALLIAEEYDDDNLKGRIHSQWAYASWFQMRTDECFEHGRQAVEAYRGKDDRSLETVARRALVDALIIQGRIEEAHKHVEIMHQIAKTSNERSHLQIYHHHSASLAQLDGDWEAACRHYDAAIETHTNSINLFHRACIEYETGHFEKGRQQIDVFTSFIQRGSEIPIEYSFGSLMIVETSYISGETRDFIIAEKWASKGLESSAPMGEKVARVALGLLAILKDDSTAAAEQFNILIEEAAGIPEGEALYAHTEPYGEFFSRYTRAIGRIDEAADHLRKTIAANKHYRPRIAWLNYELADVLLARSQKGEIEEAKVLLEEALKIAAAIGMPPLEGRVRARLDQML